MEKSVKNAREETDPAAGRIKLASWTFGKRKESARFFDSVSRFARRKKMEKTDIVHGQETFARRGNELSRTISRKRVLNEQRKPPNGLKRWLLRRWNYINGPVRWSLWNGSRRFSPLYAQLSVRKKKKKNTTALIIPFERPGGISEIYNPAISFEKERERERESVATWNNDRESRVKRKERKKEIQEKKR